MNTEGLDRLEDRIRKKIRLDNGCWMWKAAIFKMSGYGALEMGGSTRCAHRVVYELLRGPVPSGLQLDHLCRKRYCVNPAHLEAVTAKVNVNRGRRYNSEKTCCRNGHPYNEANTYWRPLRDEKVGRGCRICRCETVRKCMNKKRIRTQEAAS